MQVLYRGPLAKTAMTLIGTNIYGHRVYMLESDNGVFVNRSKLSKPVQALKYMPFVLLVPLKGICEGITFTLSPLTVGFVFSNLQRSIFKLSLIIVNKPLSLCICVGVFNLNVSIEFRLCKLRSLNFEYRVEPSKLYFCRRYI